MLKAAINLFKTLFTVFKHLFKKPVTLEYPEKRNAMPENFRGKPIVKGCIKCGTCLRVCPSGAIKIIDNDFIIDLNKCIFCGNCAFYCQANAIKMSSDYELARENVNDLKLVYKTKEGEDYNA